MSGYNYNEFISDFCARTIENQGIIDSLREQDIKAGLSKDQINEKHHEVTQLINSLFGLLIVPYEKYKYNPNNNDSMSERDLKKTAEYYKIAELIFKLEKRHRLYNDYNDRYLVSCFIRHLRNALAHSGSEGIQFMPIEKNSVIKTVIFHDKDNDNHQFCTELSVGEIRILSQLLSDMYNQLDHLIETDDLPKYKEKYERCVALMQASTHEWAKRFEQEIRIGQRHIET